MKATSPFARVPLMALGMLALLAAMWAGLVRIGWALPPLRPNWIANHGPLMISGFLGTVISLERAVALASLSTGLNRRWPYLAPMLAGLGALSILIGLPDPVGRTLIAIGSLGMVLIFAAINRARPDWAHATMGVGALLWLMGNILWLLGQPVYHVVPWWAGFLVLTISGERLELARVLLLKRTTLVLFLAANGFFLASLLLSLADLGTGVRFGGIGLIAIALWLLRFDIARKTIQQTGLTRFIAACLLPGYVWLAAAGGLWLYWGERFVAGPLYDAMLHSIMLGFVFSLIFGHAPLIVPAVMNVAVPYRPAFYAHLALLHLSLILRVAGDLASSPALRMWGGMLNVIALLLFLANTARAARQSAY
ncbi:MAG: hypothetical protein HY023_06610 [Chloroflexi bacterium]|nr:hypothetical protein [Chloroflexota bacterium]